MTCNELKYLIQDYLENKLDQADALTVEEHLKSCKSCAQIHQEYSLLMDAIAQVEEEMPDQDLELNFNARLAEEKRVLESSRIIALKPKTNTLKSIAQVAAVILLMVSSYLLGSHKSNASRLNEIASLQQEIIQMQTIATLSLMENESASKRLQAVSYAKTFVQPNDEILNVLIAKMNSDKHTNVRLAAANALAKFAESANVRQALLSVLEVEENANMQIELIQILVDIEEKRAIPAMQKLLKNEEIQPYVKEQINSELNQIL